MQDQKGCEAEIDYVVIFGQKKWYNPTSVNRLRQFHAIDHRM